MNHAKPGQVSNIPDDLPSSLRQAVAEIRVLEPPADLLPRVIDRALELAAKPVLMSSPKILLHANGRRQRMFRIARYSIMAAALLLLVVGASAVLFMDRGASLAFGQVVENVKSAKSVSFTFIQKFGSQPALEYMFYLQGDQMRVEIPGKQKAFDAGMPIVEAIVANCRTKDSLEINYSTKIVRKSKLDEAVAKKFMNPIDGFRILADKDAERVGEEELSGHKTQVYLVKKLQGLLGINVKDDVDIGEGCKAWIDSQSGLPVKIVIDVSSLAAGQKWNENATSLVFEDFKWNQELESQLFEPQIPEGFRVADGIAGGDLQRTSATATAQFPFSLVVENVKKATSVQFTADEITATNPGSVIAHNYFVQGNRIRIETEHPKDAPLALRTEVVVIDTDAKRVLRLTYPQKSAEKLPATSKLASFLMSRVEAVAGLKDVDASALGYEVLDDRMTRLYDLNKNPFLPDAALRSTPKVWVDPETNLPIQAILRVVGPQGEITLLRVKHFKWNAPVDPKLLEMDIPEGFDESNGSGATAEPADGVEKAGKR
jgi:outer membrane lipoprotein-sorting protein